MNKVNATKVPKMTTVTMTTFNSHWKESEAR